MWYVSIYILASHLSSEVDLHSGRPNTPIKRVITCKSVFRYIQFISVLPRFLAHLRLQSWNYNECIHVCNLSCLYIHMTNCSIPSSIPTRAYTVDNMFPVYLNIQCKYINYYTSITSIQIQVVTCILPAQAMIHLECSQLYNFLIVIIFLPLLFLYNSLFS